MGSAPSQQEKVGGSVTVIKSKEAVQLSTKSSVRSKSADEGRRTSLSPLSEGVQLDVMISYSHADTDQMNALKDSLTEKGFVVWVDVVGLQAGVNFFDKIGTAIINSRLFITLLSQNAIKSKYCRDEISLAYVLDKPIYPVYIEPKADLERYMDLGMRLEFSNLTWYDYRRREESALVGLTEDMEKAKNDIIKSEKIAKMARNPAKPLKRANTRNLLRSKSIVEPKSEDDFWEIHFKGKDSLDPKVFMDKLNVVMTEKLQHFIKTDLDKRYVQRIVRRKLIRKGLIPRTSYDEFCQNDVGLRTNFFDRIEEFAVERYAITQVFQVDSSVRLQAIENLGRYQTAAVIDALTELLDDSDSDARAVAAITLAKTGTTNYNIRRRLISLLRDEDRLVRESACLALGHLKVEEAVPELVRVWRTEVMSTVRDAAEMALKKVGGDEASQALHMVGVLTDEIQFLITH